MADGLSSPESTVLFVDDDEDVLKAGALLLGRHGYHVAPARNLAEALSAMAAQPMDVVLLDLNYTRGRTSGEEGFQGLRSILAMDPGAAVVVVTGHSGINVAVAAMRGGACDFIMKPWNNARLIATVEDAAALRRRRRAAALPAASDGDDGPLVGESAAMERVRELIRRAGPTSAAVLLSGPAGSGKSLVGRLLHRQSVRAAQPLVAIDLESASDHEIEAAVRDPRGATLFLDEPSALDGARQSRLMALLGGPEGRDLRLISAIRSGRERLRGDLLYRLGTIEIVLPPLAARGEDTRILAEHFLRLFALRHGRPVRSLAAETAGVLKAAAWPGEVRGLRQAIERLVVLGDDGPVMPGELGLGGEDTLPAQPVAGDLNLARSERSLVEAALRRHGFNVSHAARDLGLTRAALYRRMAKHGL